MARGYTKTKRAELEAETRERIVDAALQLHGERGPLATTISMIAERAGVQRHTVYAHLPDERAVFMACSGLHAERAPLPSPELWAAINDPSARLRTALSAIYEWFGRNEALLAAVLRDAETSPLLREVSDLRFGVPFAAIRASLSPRLDARGHAALNLALSFHTWRTLVRESGLSLDAAIDLMIDTVIPATTDALGAVSN
jgi:AcrR family transcriptional regulator